MTTQSDSIAHPTKSGLSESAVADDSDWNHTVWDRFGIAGSLLCIGHCVIATVAVGALSTAGLGFLGSEVLHQVLVIPLLIVALLAFYPGYRRHGNALIPAAGAVGIGLLVLAIFAHLPALGHGLETGLTVVGSLVLLGAHGANWRQCAHSGCPSDAE